MTAHSSILAWRIPWKEEPGRLQRVGHDGVCTHMYTVGLESALVPSLVFWCTTLPVPLHQWSIQNEAP